MKFLRMMLIVFSIGFSTHSNAAAVRNSIEADINIVGAVSCGDWINSHTHNLTAASWGEYWLIGFLSGIAAGSRIDFMKNTESSLIVKMMNKYCTSHPLDSTSAGANVLLYELIGKMQ